MKVCTRSLEYSDEAGLPTAIIEELELEEPEGITTLPEDTAEPERICGGVRKNN